MFDSFDILMYSILFFFGFCFLGMVAGAINQSAQRILGTLALLGWFLDHLFTVVEGAISIGGEAIKRIMAGVWFILKLTWIHLLWPALKSMNRAAEGFASCWEGRIVSFFGAAEGFAFLRFGNVPYWWFRLLSALFFTATVSFFILVIGYMIKNWLARHKD